MRQLPKQLAYLANLEDANIKNGPVGHRIDLIDNADREIEELQRRIKALRNYKKTKIKEIGSLVAREYTQAEISKAKGQKVDENKAALDLCARVRSDLRRLGFTA